MFCLHIDIGVLICKYVAVIDEGFGYHFPLLNFTSRPFTGEDSKSRVFITVSKSEKKNSTLATLSHVTGVVTGHLGSRVKG